MPLVSGLDVARALAGRCHIVFVTAYDEYAVAAFDEGAIDYLLKPVTAERIAKVTQRVKARLATPPLDLTALLTRLAERERVAAAQMDPRLARQRHADDCRHRCRLFPG
jgi:DNA-binding LytR/AlgR family response regulator